MNKVLFFKFWNLGKPFFEHEKRSFQVNIILFKKVFTESNKFSEGVFICLNRFPFELLFKLFANFFPFKLVFQV